MAFARIVAVALVAGFLAQLNTSVVCGVLACPPEFVFAVTYGVFVGVLALPAGPASRWENASFAVALTGGAYGFVKLCTGLLWYEDAPGAVVVSILFGAGLAMARRYGLDDGPGPPDDSSWISDCLEWYYGSRW